MKNTQKIDFISKQFEYYKTLGEKTFDVLSDVHIFWQYNETSNSIGIIVKHIWGNQVSRWTDFLTTDGEKEWRERDAEFENDIQNKGELILKWNEGWTCLFNALRLLSDEDFEKTVFIRNQKHSVFEAIERQLAHYAYHVGQIVFIGKMIADADWVSLSIPKNESKKYNLDKFSEPQRGGNFMDEYLGK